MQQTRETSSLADSLASLPEQERTQAIQSLTPDQALRVLHDWRTWARPSQLPPAGAWRWWVVLAGRGYGKTRTGAEWVHAQAEAHPGCRIALVGRTWADVRGVMVEGESGLVATAKPWNPCDWSPGTKIVRWCNGSQAACYSADKPDQLAGPQHHFAWGDEWALWRQVGAFHALDQLAFGLRLGEPRAILTSTPRPSPRVRTMLLDPDAVVTRGSTLDNQRNLAAGVVQELRRRYEGTRLGRQELHAEVLEDVEGALWTLDTIDAHRLQQVPADVQLVRIVVAIDPAVTATEESDETGIVVAALGSDDRCYVLQDLSGRMPATEWARVAVDAYHQHSASRIVAEVNQGGDLVESVLRTVDRSVAYRGVRASRGKAVRAEPVASLYEQGRVCHVGNAALAQLEDQLTSWVPGLASPDRLDALVWALTDLALGAQAASFAPHHESTHTAQRLRRERAALGTRSTRLGSGSF